MNINCLRTVICRNVASRLFNKVSASQFSSLSQRSLRLPTLVQSCSCKHQRSYSYEGDGKTTVTFLNNEEHDLLQISTYSPVGFRLASGTFLMGPVAMFPRTIFHWDVANVLDINEESLSLFWLLEPKIDVLIIGVGEEHWDLDPKLRLFLNKKGIGTEVVTTDKAVATFNYLNADRRNVAAALIPPQRIAVEMNEDNNFAVQAMKKNLFHGPNERKEKEALYEHTWKEIERAKKLFEKDLDKKDSEKPSARYRE
ncbi:NADH dehydrogenase [ubiquinone] 1 alpha subcomplex assembly factor 3 [Halotydeus destructor]|nr:NADH dehydrogenase [ubiquinone] 1 alpha subcomplex assembly factor 3 [Halotydeus destructor]